MDRSSVGDILHRGGTVLKTARSERFMEPRWIDRAVEMLNTFGTYNIQPTANTDNEFPAIAQGSVRQNPKNFKAKR